ncbi:MAG: PH domain-containing protein [Clostridia bacterium]|nr:PH domain-containing protein [Clostridia bacterium]
MGKYVEGTLGKNESIVKKAELNGLFLLGAWIKGILLCWLLFIPTIKALIATVKFFHIELAITNKRIIGKVGVLNTKALDAPLNKIQNVSVTQPFFGKLFNFGTVQIDTAAGKYTFSSIKNADAFKNMILAQVDQFEEDRVKQQASEMANAMSAAINRQA